MPKSPALKSKGGKQPRQSADTDYAVAVIAKQEGVTLDTAKKMAKSIDTVKLVKAASAGDIETCRKLIREAKSKK